MGTLSEYKIQTKAVPVGGDQTITVRGLGVDSIVALIRGQGDVMRDLYGRAVEGKLNVENTVLLDEAPIVVALIIAFGSDDPEGWEKCMEMPFADQAVLLEEIILLTLVAEGGAKKIQEIILRAVKTAGSLSTQAA